MKFKKTSAGTALRTKIITFIIHMCENALRNLLNKPEYDTPEITLFVTLLKKPNENLASLQPDDKSYSALDLFLTRQKAATGDVKALEELEKIDNTFWLRLKSLLGDKIAQAKLREIDEDLADEVDDYIKNGDSSQNLLINEYTTRLNDALSKNLENIFVDAELNLLIAISAILEINSEIFDAMLNQEIGGINPNSYVPMSPFTGQWGRDTKTNLYGIILNIFTSNPGNFVEDKEYQLKQSEMSKHRKRFLDILVKHTGFNSELPQYSTDKDTTQKDRSHKSEAEQKEQAATSERMQKLHAKFEEAKQQKLQLSIEDTNYIAEHIKTEFTKYFSKLEGTSQKLFDALIKQANMSVLVFLYDLAKIGSTSGKISNLPHIKDLIDGSEKQLSKFTIAKEDLDKLLTNVVTESNECKQQLKPTLSKDDTARIQRNLGADQIRPTPFQTFILTGDIEKATLVLSSLKAGQEKPKLLDRATETGNTFLDGKNPYEIKATNLLEYYYKVIKICSDQEVVNNISLLKLLFVHYSEQTTEPYQIGTQDLSQQTSLIYRILTDFDLTQEQEIRYNSLIDELFIKLGYSQPELVECLLQNLLQYKPQKYYFETYQSRIRLLLLTVGKFFTASLKPSDIATMGDSTSTVMSHYYFSLALNKINELASSLPSEAHMQEREYIYKVARHKVSTTETTAVEFEYNGPTKKLKQLADKECGLVQFLERAYANDKTLFKLLVNCLLFGKIQDSIDNQWTFINKDTDNLWTLWILRWISDNHPKLFYKLPCFTGKEDSSFPRPINGLASDFNPNVTPSAIDASVTEPEKPENETPGFSATAAPQNPESKPLTIPVVKETRKPSFETAQLPGPSALEINTAEKLSTQEKIDLAPTPLKPEIAKTDLPQQTEATRQPQSVAPIQIMLQQQFSLDNPAFKTPAKRLLGNPTKTGDAAIMLQSPLATQIETARKTSKKESSHLHQDQNIEIPKFDLGKIDLHESKSQTQQPAPAAPTIAPIPLPITTSAPIPQAPKPHNLSSYVTMVEGLQIQDIGNHTSSFVSASQEHTSSQESTQDIKRAEKQRLLPAKKATEDKEVEEVKEGGCCAIV